MHNVGERVLAVCGTRKDGSIDIFGSGTYIGDKIPEEAVGMLAEICRKAKKDNPCIELDNGKIVYGCECWWGKESIVKERLKGKVFNVIDIDEVRESFSGSQIKDLI